MDCAICLDEVNTTNMETLKCGHVFHSSCMVHWHQNSCPMCRALVVNEDDIQKLAHIQHIILRILNNEIPQQNVNAVNQIIDNLIAQITVGNISDEQVDEWGNRLTELLTYTVKPTELMNDINEQPAVIRRISLWSRFKQLFKKH